MVTRITYVRAVVEQSMSKWLVWSSFFKQQIEKKTYKLFGLFVTHFDALNNKKFRISIFFNHFIKKLN